MKYKIGEAVIFNRQAWQVVGSKVVSGAELLTIRSLDNKTDKFVWAESVTPAP